MKSVSITLAVVVCAMAGCAQRMGDYTAMSTKNVYAKGVDITKCPQTKGVEANDVTFLGIGASLSDAVDKALEKGNGNLMVDTAVYQVSAPFASGWRVRGTVVRVPPQDQAAHADAK